MKKINLIIRKFKGINIFKTIYANFALLSFKTAIKFPIFIYGKTNIRNIRKGKIIIAPNFLKTGTLNIGVPILDYQAKNTYTVLNIKGVFNVNGKVIIGKGSSIEVDNDGTLSIGNNTIITGNTTILCTQKIQIGGECMISWDNLIMDTDYHNIISLTDGKVYPKQKPITIGTHVWIGCRCTILKGSSIPNDSIVASNSKTTKAIDGNNVLIASNTILKENVTW